MHVEDIDWTALDGTAAALERERIGDGEPSFVCGVAGLQFHDYFEDDGLGGRIVPRAGDRLHTVRAPVKPYDGNAIEVWWRNQHRLGHLPRPVARALAAEVDAGSPLRAYVVAPGNGGSWSLRVLLVGEAVRALAPVRRPRAEGGIHAP